MLGACSGKIVFGPASWGPREGNRVKYNLFSITKSVSKFCVPNFLLILTIERHGIITYLMGFSFCRLGYALGVGLGGAWGVKNEILSVCLFVMLSPPKPLGQIQPNLDCELLTCIGRAKAKSFLAPPTRAPGRDQEVKYH